MEDRNFSKLTIFTLRDIIINEKVYMEIRLILMIIRSGGTKKLGVNPTNVGRETLPSESVS